MKKIIKKVIASTLAISLLLGNASALASAGTTQITQTQYSQQEALLYSSVKVSSTLSYGKNFFENDASVLVEADGSATLSVPLSRHTAYSGFTNYIYGAFNVQYKNTNGDYVDAVVTNTTSMANGTRPSNIEIKLDDININGIEIKYDVYRCTTSGTPSKNTAEEGMLSLNFSSMQNYTAKTPTITADSIGFTDSTMVHIVSSESNAEIFYNINGGEFVKYTGSFSVDETATITAYAKISTYLDSSFAEFQVEKLESAKSGFFGPNQIEFKEGSYEITIIPTYAGDANKDTSYADLVVKTGTLTVDANGDGRIYVGFVHGTMMNMDCYLENIKYYDASGSTVLARVEERYATSYLYSDGAPKVVSFPVFDVNTACFEMRAQAGTNSWYTNDHNFDIYIGEFMEESNGSTPEAEPLPDVEDTGFLFGANQVKIDAGKYILPIHVVKAFSQDEDSMTNKAVVDAQAILTVTSDAKATINVDYQPMDIGLINGAVSKSYYYLTDSANSLYITDATKVYENSAEFLSTYEFPIINKALDGLYVAYDVINTENRETIHTQEPAYIKFDFANISVYENETFGSSKVSLEPAIYEVPVSLMQASNTSSPSMAESVLGETAVLTIYNNKVAEIDTTYSSMTMGDTTGYAYDIKYYTANSANGSTIDATVLESDDEGNPTDVKMTVIDNSRDGIYININISGVNANQDAYIAIDYSKAVKTAELPEGATPDVPVIPEDQESEEEELTDLVVEDGVYSVPVYLKRYEGIKPYTTKSTASMADEAIIGLAKATVSGDKITYTVQFQGIYVTGLYGHLLNMWYYTAEDVADGTLTDPIPTTTISYYNDLDMYGETAKFPELVMFEYDGDVNDNVYIQTYVDAMIGYHYQDAVFVFDWNNAENDNGMSALGEQTDDEYGLSVTIPKEATISRGKAVGSYTTSEITNIISAFGDDSYDATIILELNFDEEVETAEINVTRDAIEALIHNANGVVIKTDKAEIIMSNLELYSIVRDMTGDVKFSMSDVDLAGENSRLESNNGRAAVDLTISIGNKNAHTFSKDITVKIPHNVSIDETTRRLGIYYIPDDENETPVKMETAEYKNGYVYFDTDHFSTFAITHENFIEDFNDVQDYHWFAESIEKTIELGLLTGVDGNTFNPNGNITTGMIVTVLHRLSGDETHSVDQNWYEAGMKWASENGITDNEDAFEIITREELAKMLHNYHENPELDGTIEHYIDSHEVSEEAQSAKIWATSTGIMTGKTSNTINSQENATRAELATILVRLLNR